MKYFVTKNYWRFTWLRQAYGTPLLISVPTGLYYSWNYLKSSWVRSSLHRKIANMVRKWKSVLRKPLLP